MDTPKLFSVSVLIFLVVFVSFRNNLMKIISDELVPVVARRGGSRNFYFLVKGKKKLKIDNDGELAEAGKEYKNEWR